MSACCSVTLGDEEARRRGGRKTVQERASPPTFDVAIELLERRKWCVYPDVAAAVDSLLLGNLVCPWFPFLNSHLNANPRLILYTLNP